MYPHGLNPFFLFLPLLISLIGTLGQVAEPDLLVQMEPGLLTINSNYIATLTFKGNILHTFSNFGNKTGLLILIVPI